MRAEERQPMPTANRRALIAAALAAPALATPMVATACTANWKAEMRAAYKAPATDAPDAEWEAWSDRTDTFLEAVIALPPTTENLRKKAFAISLIHDGDLGAFMEETRFSTDHQLAHQIVSAIVGGL